MTNNHGKQDTTRILRTHDLKSGEKLLMAYFPEAGVVTINGFVVNRSPEREYTSKQSVFHRELDDKLFTVPSESIAQLFL